MAPKADAYYLETCLGKHNLTMADFKRCKEIITRSGALGYAQTTAENAVEEAISILASISKKENYHTVQFLQGLVRFLLTRKA
jgi:geranylgeranyl pyrophosphate synthase